MKGRLSDSCYTIQKSRDESSQSVSSLTVVEAFHSVYELGEKGITVKVPACEATVFTLSKLRQKCAHAVQVMAS